MTRIDFYIIENPVSQAEQTLTCKLVDKAYNMDNVVYVHAADANQAQQLDQLLWTFRDGSFIPHVLHSEPNPALLNLCPVVIGPHPAQQEPPEHHHDVLINLHPEVPGFFSRFERVAEIIGPDEIQREAGRERFRFYRDRGYALETHKLSL